jgi:hypothetical protein
MKSSRHLPPVLAALAALSLAASAPAAAQPSGTEPIAAARHRALGSTVTVRGTVTVPTNAFDPGFAVQDGPAGIYVLDSGSAPRQIGDDVEITGTLVDSFGLLSIQPTAITARGANPPTEPRKHATGAIGEPTEGRLFRLAGTMVGDLFDDSPFGFIMHIDDGSGPVQLFLFPGAGISTAGLHPGVAIEVTCFSSQFDTHFECDPRQPSDLQIVP